MVSFELKYSNNMTFETINPSKPVSQSLFNGGGLFSKHAEEVVRSIILKDKSLVKNFNGLETIRDQIKFLEKHAPNLDFTSKVSSKEANRQYYSFSSLLILAQKSKF